MGSCVTCKEQMMGVDKRAINCWQCAISFAIKDAERLRSLYPLKNLYAAATKGKWEFGTDISHFDSPCVFMEGMGPSASHFYRDADAKLTVALHQNVARVLG